jgi:hypothetical protein
LVVIDTGRPGQRLQFRAPRHDGIREAFEGRSIDMRIGGEERAHRMQRFDVEIDMLGDGVGEIGGIFRKALPQLIPLGAAGVDEHCDGGRKRDCQRDRDQCASRRPSGFVAQPHNHQRREDQRADGVARPPSPPVLRQCSCGNCAGDQ